MVSFAAAQFSRVRHHSKRSRRWVVVMGSTYNGLRDSNCPSARRLLGSNPWDDQLAVTNNPKYARLETNTVIGQPKEG
ncbi:hypothetical protein TNCV_2744211 [Trichonephila clavipes]|nr:hypothetical protein TNCV_2744211 [Trichonephila clavipes]